MTALIDNSLFIAEQFEGFVKNSFTGSLVKKCGLARHRYNSMLDPMLRVLTHIFDVIGTAMWVTQYRKGRKDANYAQPWLDNLDEEKIIQGAMLCEAAHSAYDFMRKLDFDKADSSILSTEIAAFLKTIGHLFRDRGCLRMQFGVVPYVLELLSSQQRVYYCADHTVKTIGGKSPPSGAIERCLGRNIAWSGLAVSVVEAEFPEFELLQAFEWLSVTKHKHGRRQEIDDERGRRHCLRLSKTFSVDAHRLQSQHSDVIKYVWAKVEFTGMSSHDAWADVMYQMKHSTDGRHPIDALGPVVIAYLTYRLSTSKVEEIFLF